MRTNSNHPKKNSNITVDPIRSLKEINRIKRSLKDKPRDLLLFSLGINNGLRIGDLLRLKVKDVMNCQAGESFTITEEKTKKSNHVMINKEVYRALVLYIDAVRPDPDHFLFKSRNGSNKALNRSYVNSLVKKWTSKMKGNFSTHSLRKTFGFIQRTQFGVSFEILCKRFNHSNPSVTMRYLGIQDREVNNILLNEI